MSLITVADVRHFYRLHGRADRPALVLAHSIGADHGLWDAVVPALSQDFQVLRYDLRGHGATDVTPGEYDIDLLANDLLSLTAALGLDRFAVCGLSVGGMASLRATVLAPQRVQALVLCSSTARLPAPPGGWDARVAAARAQGLGAMADGMLDRMVSPEYRAINDPAIGTLRAAFLATPVDGYAACSAVLRDTDLHDQLSQVVVPTLVLTGARDPLVPAAAGDALAKSIPRAQHCTLDSGHFPPIEAPERFVETVLGFLRTT